MDAGVIHTSLVACEADCGEDPLVGLPLDRLRLR